MWSTKDNAATLWRTAVAAVMGAATCLCAQRSTEAQVFEVAIQAQDEHDADFDDADVIPPLGSGGAHSPYLFDLTEDEIIETAVHYRGENVDVEELLTQMTRPFEPSKFGDIELEAGSFIGAIRSIHRAWELGLARVPPEDLIEGVGSFTDQEYEAWFDQTYPNGVPRDDPFWRVGSVTEIDRGGKRGDTPLAAWCTVGSTVKKNSGNWRVKSQSLYHSDGIYRYARGRGYTYKKVLFVWVRTKVDDLTVAMDGEYYDSSSGKWYSFSKDCACSDCSKLTCDKLLFEEGEGAFRWKTKVTADPPGASAFSATSCNEVACC